MAIRLIPKTSPPNVLIGGLVPVSPGFPIKAFGKTGSERSRITLYAASNGESNSQRLNILERLERLERLEGFFVCEEA